MYVGLVVIAMVGFASAIVVAALERVLVPWKQAQQGVELGWFC